MALLEGLLGMMFYFSRLLNRQNQVEGLFIVLDPEDFEKSKY